MQSTPFTEAVQAPSSRALSAAGQPACEECQGSGGWFRYEPALEPGPGLLYLSCVHCRGSGRTAAARDGVLRTR